MTKSTVTVTVTGRPQKANADGFFSWFMNEMRFKRNWNVRIMSFFIQIECAFLGGKIIRLSEIVTNQFSTIILA